MFREYVPLRWSALRSVTGVRVAPVGPPARVTLDSPALSVVTDLSQTPVATIEPESSIEYANDYMRRRGVRIRGIYSLTQIARQLGANLQPNAFAQTFAEIEAALGH